MDGKRDGAAIRENAARAGLRIKLPPEPDTEVWPENWPVLEVAVRMMSQLNVGLAGVVGYRYEAMPVILDALAVPAESRLELIDDLRVVEAELVKRLRAQG